MGDVLLCELQKLVDEDQRRTTPLKVLQKKRHTTTLQPFKKVLMSDLDLKSYGRFNNV